MSGMEPLVALGLVCNILQLIEVGRDTIDLAKTVYQGKSPDKALDGKAAALESISQEVKTCMRPAKCSKLEEQLLGAVDKCFSAARDLREEIRFLVGNAKQGTLASTLKVVAKTNWRRRRLERLQTTLDGTEKLMQTGLLAQIWSSTHAAELNLSNVKRDLRSFVEEYQRGNHNTDQLVSREALITREHTSTTSKFTNTAIQNAQQTLDGLALKADIQMNDVKRERLLQSLKYPGFNERRNQVTEAYKNTFEWVFVGDGDESESDSSESEEVISDSDDESYSTGASSEEMQADLTSLPAIKWDSFSNWLRSTDNMYWIIGKPGSGKTTFMKYIMGHKKTREYLSIWSPEPLIISHYFWRPGTAMQQNIKGLLCSLLYQLLQNSDAALQHVFSHVPGSETKDADTDWSRSELGSIIMRVIKSYHRPMCIFLDGLDELDPQDGPAQLIDLVEQISESRNTKTCVASRPEPLLKRRLAAHPQLRLQDLTHNDLTQYAKDHIQFPADFVDNKQEDDGSLDEPELIASLVSKAEGVFLWLVLAVRNINRGFEYGDNMATIRERIGHLPGDLKKMYVDMWNRSCQDEPQRYRRTAALYLRLLQLNQDGRYVSVLRLQDLSLLRMMFASNSLADPILGAIDKPQNLVSENILLQKCREVERTLVAYCFGLVEISPKDSARDVLWSWYGTKYDRLLPFSTKYIRFIHRTARDFLLDTVEGKEIRSYDSSSDMSLLVRLFRADLAEGQLYCMKHTGRSILDQEVLGLRVSPEIRGGINDVLSAEWFRTLDYWKKRCDSGRLVTGNTSYARICGGSNFLKTVAEFCGKDYLLHRVEGQKVSNDGKSEILLNACYFVGKYGTPLAEQLESIKFLLKEGADPNWRGSLFSPARWIRQYAQVETPFACYLANVMQVAWNLNPGPQKLANMLGTVYVFVFSGARLDDMVPLNFSTTYEGHSRSATRMFVNSRFSIRKDFSTYDSALLACVPAHTVVDMLLSIVHHRYPRFSEETGCGAIPESLAGIPAKGCNNRTIRVLGKVNFMSYEREPEWFEAAREQLDHIGNDLRDELEEIIVSWTQYDPLWDEKDHAEREKDVRLLQHVPWVSKSRDLIGICERLEELGFLTNMDRICELHDVETWAKINRQC